MFGVKVWWNVIIEEHTNDDSEECRDDRHGRMVAERSLGVGITDLSLSRARPSRATIPDVRTLAKHEGLQARVSVRPRIGCSEKLACIEVSNE